MSMITRPGVSALIAFAGTGFALAQGSRSASACDDSWPDGNRARADLCEVREFTLPPEDSLQIDGGPNGNVSVTGWDRDEIRVRARIRSWDREEDAARARLDEIEIDTDGRIRVHGPNNGGSWRLFRGRPGGWNVSFEVKAPKDTDLWIESTNGGIAVTSIRGSVDAETTNGGISFTDVSATTRGRTVNGGISAVLSGDTLDGETLDLRTTNGGIVIRIPENFSARLDIATVNGTVQSDFPVSREGPRNREVTATLGSGGPLIRGRAVNGGVRIAKL